MSKGFAMKRVLVALILISAATVGMSSASIAGESTATGCTEPRPERTYAADHLVYRLAVDLTNCEWWDGSPIQLEAELERLDGTAGHGAWSGTVCGIDNSAMRTTTDASGTNEQPAKPLPGGCEIQVTMEHPSFETAYYRGEITFPGADGRRSLSFTAVCGQPAGCVDLPVDPIPMFAPIGDLVANNAP